MKKSFEEGNKILYCDNKPYESKKKTQKFVVYFVVYELSFKN
jgi:hypothetical protein